MLEYSIVLSHTHNNLQQSYHSLLIPQPLKSVPVSGVRLNKIKIIYTTAQSENSTNFCCACYARKWAGLNMYLGEKCHHKSHISLLNSQTTRSNGTEVLVKYSPPLLALMSDGVKEMTKLGGVKYL